MLDYLKLYAGTLVVFLAVDLLWIGVIARGFYKEQLAPYLTDNPVWSAAFAFYFLFVAGLIYFVVAPGLRESSSLSVVASGAFFGLIAYATYDLTNQATVKDWPALLTIVDMAWGTFLSAVVSFTSFQLGQWLAIGAE